MSFRIATLNLGLNQKCWESRRELIATQLKDLDPDTLCLNEIHLPAQTGRWLQRAVKLSGIGYALLQQCKAGADSRREAEGMLTRLPLVETANLDYQSYNCVALAARFEVAGRSLDIYVTHLIAARVQDRVRQYQVAQLLDWIRTRDDADYSVICGDFNAAPDQPSIQLISKTYRATQTQPTAFTPLREPGGKPSHPESPRFDRCIDYIWVSQTIEVLASGLCFNEPAKDNPELWPSDHVGVWADLDLA